MDPLPGTARIPNGVGCAGLPRSLCPRPAACIVCTLRDGWAGSLTPSGAWSGLDGPMPRSIALVLRGRCRPSPDRVPEGASPDRDAAASCRDILRCGVVSGFCQCWPPHLRCRPGPPRRSTGRLGGHGHEPGLELPGGDAGDQLPEPLLAAVLLAGLLAVKSRSSIRSRPPRTLGPVQQAGEGVADLCVAVVGGTGQVVREPLRVVGRIMACRFPQNVLFSFTGLRPGRGGPRFGCP